MPLTKATQDVMNLTGPLLHVDGTLALPSISFKSEPTAGFMRAGAGAFQAVIGGVPILGLTAAQVATGAGVSLLAQGTFQVVGAASFNGMANSSIFLATGITSAIVFPATSTCSMFNQGLVTGGVGAAGTYGDFSIYSRDGVGSFTGAPVYKWVHTAGSPLGTHIFSQLTSPHGSQTNIDVRLCGPRQGGSGLGAGYLPVIYNANVFGQMDWEITDPNPGNLTSVYKVAIANAGVVNQNGDLTITRSTQGYPQTLVNGSMNPTLSGLNSSPLMVASSPGAMACIGMKNQLDTYAIFAWTNASWYWGCEGGPGPVGGWSMNLTPVGACTAATFTPCDAALKEDVTPIGAGALDAVLKLKGVRFTHKHDQRPGIGLIAQDVKPVFPEAVGSVKPPPDEVEILTIEYGALTAPIIEAIREINERLTLLEVQPK